MSDPAFRLDGRVALVTGAGRGIGAAVALALADRGADVVLCARSEDSLREAAEGVGRRGRRALVLPMDIRDLGLLDGRLDGARQELDDVDILVNNAGVNRPAPGLDVREGDWDEQFDTNVKAGFFLAQKLAPAMIAKGWGRIIWMSSQSGLVGIPGQPVYCATKGAVTQLVRTLAAEWGAHGVTVNAVAPTFVDTALTRERLQRPEYRTYVLDMIPVGRLATVEEVAAAVVYLASDEAAMVNGHTLTVDGGWTAW